MSNQSGTNKVLVWDAPTRLFHWLMVLCFAVAYGTAESERWRLVHVTLGYTMGGLVAFRLVWGFVGTRYARFAEFLRGPSVVWRYVHSIRRGAPEHYTGHNPVGALAIVLILLGVTTIVVTGAVDYNVQAPEWVAQCHAWVADALLTLIVVHVAGVVVASLQHRENLVRAMITGYKAHAGVAGAARAWRGLAIVIFLVVLIFWFLQWRSAP